MALFVCGILSQMRRVYMKTKTKNFIKGFGSLIDICPQPNYDRIAEHRRAEDIINESWNLVRRSFENAIGEFCDEEQRKQSK